MIASQIQKVEVVVEKQFQNGYKTCLLIDQIQNSMQVIFISYEAIMKNQKKIQHNWKGSIKHKQKQLSNPKHKKWKQNLSKIGEILRIEENIRMKNEQAQANLEQKQYLEFKGQYGIEGTKQENGLIFGKDKKLEVGFSTYRDKNKDNGLIYTKIIRSNQQILINNISKKKLLKKVGTNKIKELVIKLQLQQLRNWRRII